VTQTPQPAGNNVVKRRTFLDVLLGIGFVSTAVAFVYPIWRYLTPPAVAEATTTSVDVTKASQMEPNSGQVFKFGDHPAILIRTPDGTFRAFTAVCTHLGCTVQYRSGQSDIWCPCHNGIYDRYGQVVSGPPPRPLEEYKVNLRGQGDEAEVVVSRG
jgi:cytochrome b6-f complex iron-sulfur subunit